TRRPCDLDGRREWWPSGGAVRAPGWTECSTRRGGGALRGGTGRWPLRPDSGQAKQGDRCGLSRVHTWRTARTGCPSLQSQPLRSPEVSCSIIVVSAELDDTRKHSRSDETYSQVYLTG